MTGKGHEVGHSATVHLLHKRLIVPLDSGDWQAKNKGRIILPARPPAHGAIISPNLKTETELLRMSSFAFALLPEFLK